MEPIPFVQDVSLKDEMLNHFVQLIKANAEQIINGKGVNQGSKKTYWKSIRLHFFDFLDSIDELENPKLILRRYKEYLKDKEIQQNTKYNNLAAAKSLFKEMYDLDLLPSRIDDRVRNFPQQFGNRKAYSRGELDQLFSIIQEMTDEYRRARLQAIFSLFGFTGLRSQEVCNLKIEHIDLHTGNFYVLAKGEKMDLRSMNEPTLVAVRNYLLQDGRTRGFLFTSLSRRNPGGQIATSTLRNYLRELCILAGISLKGLHAFRRGVADVMDANGASLHQIAAWLGHGDNITTTVRYFRQREIQTRIDEAKKFI
jgi:integrase